MMFKLSSDKYSFTCQQEDSWIITRVSFQDKVKDFKQKHGCLANVKAHMNSLTDVQMAEFFKGK